MKFFKSVYYDKFKNKIYLKENINGKDNREVINPPFNYYVKDPTGLSEIKDIYGIPVIKKETRSFSGLKSIQESGIPLWESDILPEIKFIQERYKNEELKVDISKFNIGIFDIEIECESEFPKPEEVKYPINLITIWLSKTNQIYTFGLKEYTGNSNEVKNYIKCDDEEELIEEFINFIRNEDLDILSGWNIDKFDIPYIINRCEKLDIRKSLSPINIINKNEKYGTYEICGLLVLDYLTLYKNFTFEQEASYSLNVIGIKELKKGKLDFEGLINDLWKRDWNKYVEYNIQDVMLVKEINDNKKFIELVIQLAYLTLIPIDKCFSSIALHTGFILKNLHQKNLVMPDKVFKSTTHIPGGYVDAISNLYKYVISFDVESLYPHLILLYNISPETLRLNPKNTEDLIKTPVEGVYYDRRKGILSEIIESILVKRKSYKNKMKICNLIKEDKNKEEICDNIKITKEKLNTYIKEMKEESINVDYYKSQQQIYKILANSLYGVLANNSFHFFNVNNAKAITLGGQDLIKYLSNQVNDYFQNHFYKNKDFFDIIDKNNNCKKPVVVLIDTDSNYICLEEIIKILNLKFNSNQEFLNWSLKFNEEFLKPFFDKLLEIYVSKINRPQIINFKMEKISTKMAVLAKKKYVLEVLYDEGRTYNIPELIYKGIEVVRSSTPKWCRDKIKETIKYSFDVLDRELIIDKLRELKKEFKKQKIEDIAFPRGVNNFNDFEKRTINLKVPKGCPIHVRGAIFYNYLIKKYNISAIPISDKSKLKFIYLFDNNELHTNIIAFIGSWPKSFEDKFKIDYNTQWEKSFQSVVQRFFDVFKWGKINLENQSLNKFFI